MSGLRKYQQKQILEMIQMLDEVNAELRHLFSYGDFESTMRI